MSDFDFTIKSDGKSPRQAYRTKVPGLRAVVAEKDESFAVKDISATGLAIEDKTGLFKEGDTFQFDLFIKKKPFLTKLTAEVIRVLGNGMIGCNFVDLSPRKEARLDKLVLEVQKRLIAMKKAKSKDGTKET